MIEEEAETGRRERKQEERSKYKFPQAACIVHNATQAWQYYLDLKKRFPNCLTSFKHLYKHILAVLITEVHLIVN